MIYGQGPLYCTIICVNKIISVVAKLSFWYDKFKYHNFGHVSNNMKNNLLEFLCQHK